MAAASVKKPLRTQTSAEELHYLTAELKLAVQDRMEQTCFDAIHEIDMTVSMALRMLPPEFRKMSIGQALEIGVRPDASSRWPAVAAGGRGQEAPCRPANDAHGSEKDINTPHKLQPSESCEELTEKMRVLQQGFNKLSTTAEELQEKDDELTVISHSSKLDPAVSEIVTSSVKCLLARHETILSAR
eukprot:TRINITY_DN14263_c0_g1_i1.p1 TRINITY_DN14263_c0_g1~~TRINITY_DN14263_c0_g1_i1.p1  ORF type:complete len:187 (+),score=40.82 TRINITY_DN14263_c0_g1_i1:81-641(+)